MNTADNCGKELTTTTPELSDALGYFHFYLVNKCGANIARHCCWSELGRQWWRWRVFDVFAAGRCLDFQKDDSQGMSRRTRTRTCEWSRSFFFPPWVHGSRFDPAETNRFFEMKQYETVVQYRTHILEFMRHLPFALGFQFSVELAFLLLFYSFKTGRILDRHLHEIGALGSL